jgi:hypothetical protein
MWLSARQVLNSHLLEQEDRARAMLRVGLMGWLGWAAGLWEKGKKGGKRARLV